MSEQKSGNFSAKKGCIWAAVAMVGLIVLGNIIGGDGSKSGSTQTTIADDNQAIPVEELAVTARELAQAYQDNEAAAQIKYGNKPLAVTGTITGITLDFMDNPVVELGGVNEFMPVQGAFVDKAAAADLKKGQKITLHCESVSEVVSIPQLGDCRL